MHSDIFQITISNTDTQVKVSLKTSHRRFERDFCQKVSRERKNETWSLLLTIQL